MKIIYILNAHHSDVQLDVDQVGGSIGSPVDNHRGIDHYHRAERGRIDAKLRDLLRCKACGDRSICLEILHQLGHFSCIPSTLE